MNKYLVHSQITFDLLKVVEAVDEEAVELAIEIMESPEEYQLVRDSAETILTVSPISDDFDLHSYALGAGYA